LVESNGIAEADQTTERPEELDIETVQGETRRLMEDASIAEVEDKKFRRKAGGAEFPGVGVPRHRERGAVSVSRLERDFDQASGPLKGNHL
jgi:hypothetical protein